MTIAGVPHGQQAGQPTSELLGLLSRDLDVGFGELVARYGPVLYSVALRVSDQPFDAEDLTAEAFLRAYRALRGYPPERISMLQPRAWLVSILLNTWRNAVRSATRRPRQVPLPEAGEPPIGGPGVEQLVESNETLGELARLLAQLPRNQRIAVVLRHVAGLSIPEVAAAIGCPEGTAKSYVSRGLHRLRQLYPESSGTGTGAAVTPLRPRLRTTGRRSHGTYPYAIDDAASPNAAGRKHR